jgi:hypothetical protein
LYRDTHLGASKNPFIGTSGEKEDFSDAANRPRKKVFRDAHLNMPRYFDACPC